LLLILQFNFVLTLKKDIFGLQIYLMPKKLPYLFVLLVLFIPHLLVAAGEDTVEKNVQKEVALNKALHLFNQADSLKNANPKLALSLNREALAYAHNTSSNELLAKINSLMGELYTTENNLQPAINYFLISEKLYAELGDKKALATIWSLLGRLYYNNNFELNKALTYYNKMMDYAVELGDKELLASANDNLGGLFLNLGDKEKARTYYKKLLSISEELNDKAGIGRALNNIGEIERLEGNYSKAFEYYHQSLAIHKQIKDLRRMAINLENIGSTYDAMGKREEAVRYFKEALKNYQMANDQPNSISVLLLLAKDAAAQDSVDKSLQYYKEAYDLSLKHQIIKYQPELLAGLSGIYEKTGNLKTALFFYKKFEAVKDSIFREKEKNNIAAVKAQLLSELNNIQYKLQKNDIEMLTKDKKISRLRTNILIASLIIIFLTAVLIVIRYTSIVKKQRQIREKDSELHKAQQELMETELKSKDDDLINFALHIVQKNKLLKELRTDLKELATNTDPQTSKKLKAISFNVKQMLQIQKDIDLFEQKVNQTYDGFFGKLKNSYPNLTKNEERLCAMLKLKLSSKEIASINNTSVKAVEMSRYRLRKKCGIDNKTSLTDYIGNL